MQPFERLSAIAAPIPLANVDTDKILPAEFLKTTERRGLGAALFHPLRFDAEGREREDFVLNRSPWRDAQILVALENFGCGSSREHAPWALGDFGIRAVVAPSFADIFRQNSVRNGILPAIVSPSEARELVRLVADPGSALMTIDLLDLSIEVAHEGRVAFAIDESERSTLLTGMDDVARAIALRDVTEAHILSRRAASPWLTEICSPI